MSPAHPRRADRAAVFSLLGLIGAVALSGCAEPGIPPEEKEAINTGVNAEVGSLDADNLLLITSAEGEPGRLLGNLRTSAEDPVEVTFSDDDERISITVPPQSDERDGFQLEENAHVFESTEARPGALATISVSVEGESEEVRVPVFDGSLERYRPFLPEG